MPDYPHILDFAGDRKHVIRPQDWGEAVATDYWANWGNVLMADAAAQDLVANGWLTSGFSHTIGSAAGVLDASAVGTTGGLNFAAVSDYLISPIIFGDYAHGRMAQAILGYFPTTINMECLARFAAGDDQEETGFGFLQDGTDANALVKADLMAFVTVDGTNFSLESSAAADAGSTKATTPHLFKVTGTTGSTFEWWIDGVSQGTLATVANQAPMAWGAGTKAASGTNDPVISWVHIWYA